MASNSALRNFDHGQVMVERLCHRRLVEPLGSQPRLVGVGPGRPATPGAAVAQQELAQPVPRPGEVFDHVGPSAAQIPHGLLVHGRDADTDQLAGAVQPGQSAAVTLVGLDLVAGRSGISDGAITWQLTLMLCNSRASSNPVGPAS
jgi:hypothetical protein